MVILNLITFFGVQNGWCVKRYYDSLHLPTHRPPSRIALDDLSARSFFAPRWLKNFLKGRRGEKLFFFFFCFFRLFELCNYKLLKYSVHNYSVLVHTYDMCVSREFPSAWDLTKCTPYYNYICNYICIWYKLPSHGCILNFYIDMYIHDLVRGIYFYRIPAWSSPNNIYLFIYFESFFCFLEWEIQPKTIAESFHPLPSYVYIVCVCVQVQVQYININTSAIWYIIPHLP